ncbi:MAG: vWA domain-containing protein [Gemmatimonadaceae bacterium]
MTLSIRTDRELIRAGARSNRYLLLGYDAPAAPRREERRPVNVAFVLDRSGSMQGERKFNLARQAVEFSLRMLRPEDRFSLVVYDDRVNVLAHSSNATPAATRNALQKLSSIEPRGSTDLFSGWMHGCEQVAEFVHDEKVSRVLLLTDGLANHGTTDRDTIGRHASELRERGVTTSTFGVGTDFDERLLRDMAHEGGGNFYYIENARQIADLITSELGEALEVVIPRAALEVQIPAGCDVELLNRFRSTRVDGALRIELGDIVSSQQVEVLLRVNFPRGGIGDRVRLIARLFGDTAMSETSVGWTYASHAENDSQPRDREVDRQVAEVYAARARAAATEANRHADFEGARRVIEATVARIRQYAGNDPVLRRIWQKLERERPQYELAVMSPAMMKGSFYAAEMMVKGRGSSGRARRST